MSVAHSPSGPLPEKPENSLSRALALIKEAARHHPQMTVFAAVLAVAAVGAAIWTMYGFSTENAVFFTAFAVCVAHVILPWVYRQAGQPRAVAYLMIMMAWGLSAVLLLSVAALAASSVGCRLGYLCAPPTPPSQHVAIGKLSLLDEHDLDTTDPAAHVFKRLTTVSRNTVWYAPGRQPVIALLTTMNGFGHRADGSIDIRTEIYIGKDDQDLTLADRWGYSQDNSWRNDGLVKRYPGGADSVVADLRAQGLTIRPDTIVMLSTITCLPSSVIDAKSATIKVVIFDRVTETYSAVELPAIWLKEQAGMKTAGCRAQSNAA